MKEEAIVAQEGFEPSIPKGRGILSPLCMPVPPLSHYILIRSNITKFK
nr:MAG TPA: hypothetical protein [Crassvirales sp.]